MGRALSGVRARTTLIATAIAGVALVIGAVLLLWVLGNNLRQNLDSTAEAQADDRAQLIDSGADPASLVASQQSESVIWIGSADGTPIAVGGNYQVVGSLPNLAAGPARTETLLVEEVYESGSVERETIEVTLAVSQASDGTLVAVGSELETVTSTTNEVRNLLSVGLPLLLAMVGFVTWRATGRTLQPVAHIRQTAESIGSGPIDARVPVPDTDDEINRLAVTVNSMLDRLDAQHQSQRRFTADASHELKSPVANMRAIVDTTAMADPSWAELQHRLGTEASRLSAIVDNLLFMAVDDERAGVMGPREHVDLDDILFDEAELLATRAASAIVVDISGVQPCELMGYPDQLRRAVRNLLQNGERYAASRVSVSCMRGVDGVVTLTVSDDGPGVPADKRQVIFERFGRSDDARDRRSGGTGLGLAIVASIVTNHAGTIAVDDTPGGGAAFTISLPAEVS